MSAAFTPGPWLANCSHIYAPDGAIIATVSNPGSKATDYPLVANRDLMRAAPELYEALEIAAALIGRPSDFRGLEDDDEIEHVVMVRIGHVKQFLATLRKARGETPNDGSIPSGGSGL